MRITKPENFETNPSILFARSYQPNIQSVRSQLLSELNSVSPQLYKSAKKLLDNKIKGSELPPLGEIFPWVIKDLLSLDDSDVKEVSVGWLALYLYTIFIDNYVDLKVKVSAEDLISSSLLLTIGMRNLGGIVKDTEYESIFYSSIFDSAKYQYIDVKNQETFDLKNKEISAEGKNRFLIICAASLASIKSEHGAFIIEFTKSLLLALQYLDDISDFEEDYHSKNMTALLTLSAYNTKLINGYSLENVSRKQLLRDIIISGALYRIVSQIEKQLRSCVLLINNYILLDIKEKQSWYLLNSLLDNINILKLSLRKIKDEYDLNEEMIDKIELQIKIIAQSS